MKKINALQLRQSMGKILASLERAGEPILLERGRKPVGVIISLQDFEERFHETAAAAERDAIIAEIEAMRRPTADGRSVIELVRAMRYGE